MNLERCPICRGDAFPLGTLGKLLWHCCRYCGWQFSTTTNDDDTEEA